MQNTLTQIIKKDQFVNIAKNQESTQPNMNSIIKTAAKITEELSQPNEKSGKWKTKYCMGNTLEM